MSMRFPNSNRPTQIIAILRNDGERYVFLFDEHPASSEKLLQLAGQYAADPSLSFTWLNACQVAWKLRELSKQA